MVNITKYNWPALLPVLLLVIFQTPTFQLELAAQQSLNAIINRAETSDMVPIEKVYCHCLCVPKGHFLIIRTREELMYHLENPYNEDCDKQDTLAVDFENEAIVAIYVSMTGMVGSRPQVDYFVERFDFEKTYMVYLEYPIHGMRPHYERSIIKIPVESMEWDVEVIVLDRRREFLETKKSCRDFYD